jgi:hypothetical protein
LTSGSSPHTARSHKIKRSGAYAPGDRDDAFLYRSFSQFLDYFIGLYKAVCIISLIGQILVIHTFNDQYKNRSNHKSPGTQVPEPKGGNMNHVKKQR